MNKVVFLLFTSFHTSGSTMLANKHNMVLETFGLLFIVTRDDVSQLCRVTSECNEHIYGNWRQILHELNMEQLIDLMNKCQFIQRQFSDKGCQYQGENHLVEVISQPRGTL